MPRRKKYDTVPEIVLADILRDVTQLRFSLTAAMTYVVPFNPHYEALRQIGVDLTNGLRALGHVPEPHRSWYPRPGQRPDRLAPDMPLPDRD